MNAAIHLCPTSHHKMTATFLGAVTDMRTASEKGNPMKAIKTHQNYVIGFSDGTVKMFEGCGLNRGAA